MGRGGFLGGLALESQSEDFAILQKLFPKKRDEQLMATDITPDLLFDVVALEVIADRYGSPLLKSIASKIYQAEMSKDRKSRVEIIEAALGSRRSGLEGLGE